VVLYLPPADALRLLAEAKKAGLSLPALCRRKITGS
jgi:hypothetical protein